MKTLLVVLATSFFSAAAHADELNLSRLDAETAPNRVHVTTGAEYAFVAGIGYSRTLPFLDRQIVLGGELTVPWASFDLSDFRVRAGGLMPITGSRRWKLAGSLATVVRGTKNDISRMTDIGLDAGLVGGFYERRWFIAAEAGVDAALTTHVAHTDLYRMTVHEDAVDGWYAIPGGNVRAGLQAGVSIDRYDVILRAGQLRDFGGEPPVIPFYGTLTVNARW